MMPTVASIAARIAREGQNAILRLADGSVPPSWTDIPVRLVLRGYEPELLAGTLQQGDRRGWISGVEIAAAGARSPRKGDRLLVEGTTVAIVAAETRHLRGAPALHVLALRG